MSAAGFGNVEKRNSDTILAANPGQWLKSPRHGQGMEMEFSYPERIEKGQAI